MAANTSPMFTRYFASSVSTATASGVLRLRRTTLRRFEGTTRILRPFPSVIRATHNFTVEDVEALNAPTRWMMSSCSRGPYSS